MGGITISSERKRERKSVKKWEGVFLVQGLNTNNVVLFNSRNGNNDERYKCFSGTVVSGDDIGLQSDNFVKEQFVLYEDKIVMENVLPTNNDLPY